MSGNSSTSRDPLSALRLGRWQIAAILLSCLFGAALILNIEMGGEAMWFWYATELHHGVKLYSDLHLLLQPLFPEEMNAWMVVFGKSVIAIQLLALLHVVLLAGSMFLVLRESHWPDWQKAVLLFGCFSATVYFVAYRFDDFHVTADCFYILSMALLLQLGRARTFWRTTLFTAALGVLAGLAITNRLTDGGVLFLAAGCSVPFLAPRRRLGMVLLYILTALLVWFTVVKITGDSLQAYWSTSVVHASGAKGGTSHVLAGPVVALADTGRQIFIGNKRRIVVYLLIAAAGLLAERLWHKKKTSQLVAVQLAVLVLLRLIPHFPGKLKLLLSAELIGSLSALIQPFAYILTIIVVIRAVRAGLNRDVCWDARETVVFVPLASLLSAAVSQATGTSNSTITMVLLVLLLPVFIVRSEGWLRASVITMMLAAAFCGVSLKVCVPYNWGSMKSPPMFTGRVWYRHPLYGPMYIDRNILAYNNTVCKTIGADDPLSRSRVQLLSIPFPYVNYFCGIPLWRDHVQLWYDTVSPETVATVMHELDTAPPKWLLYQRSYLTIRAHEKEYNQDRPIPHHYLDSEIAGKVSSGEWKIVRKDVFHPGEGWFLIQTQP